MFEDSGISEFSIYTDGVVVASRSNTEVLEGFLLDLLSWASNELGIVEVEMPNRARFYESNLVVHLKVDYKKLAPWAAPVAKRLSRHMQAYDINTTDFGFGGLALAVDQTKKPGPYPSAFKLEPRTGLSFDANIFYSGAPLKTNDHLALLEDIEAQLSPRSNE